MIQSIISRMITEELTSSASSIQCLVLEKNETYYEIFQNCLFTLINSQSKKTNYETFTESFNDNVTVADWNYKFFLEKLLDPRVYGIILELRDGSLLNLLNHQVYFPNVKQFLSSLDIKKIHTYYNDWYMKPTKELNLIRVYNIMLFQNYIKANLKPVKVISQHREIYLEDSIRGRTLDEDITLPRDSDSVIIFTVSFLVASGQVFPYYGIYEATSRLHAKPITDFLSGNVQLGEENKICFGNSQKTLENLYNVMDRLNTGSTYYDRYIPIPDYGRDQVTAFKLSLYGHLTGTLEQIMKSTRDKALAKQQVVYS